MKKIFVFLLFPLLFFCGFFVSENNMQKKIENIGIKEKQCQSQLKQTVVMAKKDQTQNEYISIQKEKELEGIVESKVYFSSKISRISATETEVNISLMGGADMKIDASDLILDYSDNIKIISIIPGSAFPSYPRKLLEGGKITVTGVASLNGTGIKLGQTNQIFVTLRVEKMKDLNQKGTITLNKGGTSAFFQGNPILDFGLTFEKIEL